jgi:hypothetical protein
LVQSSKKSSIERSLFASFVRHAHMRKLACVAPALM